MNKNMMMAVLLVGAALMWKRAQAKTAAPVSSNAVGNNFNNDMWKKVLGGGWTELTQGGESVPFLMRNLFGQVTTSDGKPIDNTMQDILPSTYMTPQSVDLTAASGGVDYLGEMGW